MSLRDFRAGHTPRPQLTPSQWAAAAAFDDAKFHAKATRIGWELHHMRNAWAAYHAGEPWMRGVFELFQELASAEAEVERLRSALESR